jgi:hypothetical protein
MPFKSKAQQRAAFGGYLGKEMQGKAEEWAHETPNLKSLPSHVHHRNHVLASSPVSEPPHLSQDAPMKKPSASRRGLLSAARGQ